MRPTMVRLCCGRAACTAEAADWSRLEAAPDTATRASRADWPQADDAVLRVDGGMTASEPAMQFLADILGAPVDRPRVTETTALGAAYLAGLQAGLCPEPAEFAGQWALDRRFEPQMDEAERARRYQGWQRAVRATIAAAPDGAAS